MRGAPQVGFSATIRMIKARTSLLTRFRPPACPTLEIHVQYKRNPARCQFTTVRGVTRTRGFLQPDQNVRNATQNSLCRAVNRRRGRCACSASNCRRRARFSRMSSSRELKALTNQPRKCRSDAIIARILSEKSESSFSPSHSFCRCTTFWRGTACDAGSRSRVGASATAAQIVCRPLSLRHSESLLQSLDRVVPLGRSRFCHRILIAEESFFLHCLFQRNGRDPLYS